MSEYEFIHSTLATGTPTPVNMRLVYVFEKATGADYSPGKTEENIHQIHFRRSEQFSGPKDVIWKYCNSEDRDAEYANIVALISTPIS